MPLLSFQLCLWTAALTTALVPFPLAERAIGQSCTTPVCIPATNSSTHTHKPYRLNLISSLTTLTFRQDGAGTCQSTADCTTQGFNLAGYCPGAANIQCCIKTSCSTSSGDGTCMNASDKCGGSFVGGACPGDSSIEVSPPVPSPTNSDLPKLKKKNNRSAASPPPRHRLLQALAQPFSPPQ